MVVAHKGRRLSSSSLFHSYCITTASLMGPFYSVALLILIRQEKKVSKDSPKGRVSILSPLELPLNDQRRCLWKPGEAPALVLFHAQARPAREASA